MQVRFSRHAGRRASLYNIPETAVLDILRGMKLETGENVFVESVEGFSYPIKLIVVLEGESVTVITCYPWKKGRRE